MGSLGDRAGDAGVYRTLSVSSRGGGIDFLVCKADSLGLA